MTQNDPTDHALAAIAEILDGPAPDSVKPEADLAEIDPVAVAAAELGAADIDEADGYTRAGPGPLDALRFRWIVRRAEDGRYYVDETIGTHSLPIASGPYDRDEAIRVVNQRERDAHERYETLRAQMMPR